MLFRWIQLRLIAPASLVTLAVLAVTSYFSGGASDVLPLLAAGAAFLALTLWVLGIRSHDEAIRELVHAAETVRTGGKVPPLDTEQRPDELGALAVALRRASRELRRQASEREVERDELRAVLWSIEEGLIAVDHDLRVLHWNPQAKELLGLSWLPGAGTELSEAMDRDELVELARRSLGSLEVEHQSTPMFAGEHEQRRVELSAAPIVRDERARGVVLILRDVTERIEQEQVRREFAANVSHELRTPLSLVKGFVETLQDGALEDQERGPRFLAIIGRHVEGLEHLVNDLLTLLTLEGRTETRPPEQVDVLSRAKALLAGYEERLARQRIVLEVDIPEDLPCVLARPDHFERALRNLVDNAAKYTNVGGTIAVSAWAAERVVSISVRDNGIGIPEQDLPLVFTRFYRVDKSRSREQGGTGLGLTIVKQIMEVEQGEVTVKSVVGEGTTLTVAFRRAVPAQAASFAQHAPR
ncbi:sensor histidine kinase [Planctomycetota bacterium]